MQESIGWLTKKLVGRSGEDPSVHRAGTTGLLVGLALVTICLLAYIPAMQGGFIWDDDRYVSKNPLLFEPDGLYRIWFSKDPPSQYFPMVYTSFRLEYSLWELNPVGYHITNILLHAINALLLWRLLRYLSIPGAWLAAAIFAIHPVQVESVAWISERKNLLMAFFFFLSLLAWVRFADRSHQSEGGWFFYVFSLLLYILALLSKTTACTLPAALVLLLWLKHIPVNYKRWLQIAPYVLLGLAMGILTIRWEQYHQGMCLVDLGLNPIERTLIASRALWFYIGKLVWPINLAFSYPKWDIDAADLLQYTWLLAWVIVAWCIWHWRDRIGRGPIAAIAFFASMLSPMLGFFSLFTFVYTYVADHYQYIGSIGPIALVAAVVYRALARLEGLARNTVKITFVFVLVALGTLTWHQCHIYKNRETLWRDTIKKNPNSWLANNNLGTILLLQNKLGDAIDHFNKALKVELNIDFNRAFTYSNLGQAFEFQGEFDQAVAWYRQALETYPNDAQVHNQLGRILRLQGKLDEATLHYRQALQLEPGNAKTHHRLGALLQAQGKLNEAIDYYNRALRLKPDFFEAYNNLGVISGMQGKLDEAARCYRKALQLNPDYAKAHNNIAKILNFQGHFGEAIKHFTEALRIQPDYTNAHINLATVLKSQGKPDEAISHLRQALQVEPNNIEAHNNYGIALADKGQFNQALEQFSQVLRISPQSSGAHVNIGRVFLMQDRTDEAIKHCKEALLIEPNLSQAYECLGQAYVKQGKYDLAIQSYEQALQIKPNSAETYHSLGNALRLQGKLGEAAECYRNAVRLNPGFAAAYNNLGVVLEMEGKLDEAISSYRKALQVNPEDALTRSKLERARALQGKLDGGD